MADLHWDETITRIQLEIPPVDLQAQHALSILSKYRIHDGRTSLIAIFVNYAVIGSSIFLAEHVSQSYPTVFLLRFSIYLLAALAITSRLRAFENLVHEASHFNLFASPSTHYLVEPLYAFPVFRIVADYRHSHLLHHQHLGDPLKDPDSIRLLKFGLEKMPDRPFYYFIVLPFSGLIHWDSLNTIFLDFWASRTSYPRKAVFWALALYITRFFFPATCMRLWGLYYAIPFFGVLPVVRYWAEASEHLGLDLTKKFGNSRSNLGFLHRWFIHPHNDGYHSVHHLLSQVPFHQLPRAHIALMENVKAFQTETVISTSFAETFRQMVKKRTVFKGAVDEGK